MKSFTERRKHTERGRHRHRIVLLCVRLFVHSLLERFISSFFRVFIIHSASSLSLPLPLFGCVCVFHMNCSTLLNRTLFAIFSWHYNKIQSSSMPPKHSLGQSFFVALANFRRFVLSLSLSLSLSLPFLCLPPVSSPSFVY